MLSALVAIEMVILQLLGGVCCLGAFCAVCIELSSCESLLEHCLAKKHRTRTQQPTLRVC